MFSGIIEEKGHVLRAKAHTLVISACKTLQELKKGASISVNGACLTVIDSPQNSFAVNLSPETLNRTNLGLLKEGSTVNLERALGLGARLDGHIVQGHVDGTGKIESLTDHGDFLDIQFIVPGRLDRYIVEKGFIAVDGVSLTVSQRNPSSFIVAMIPYTYQNTVLGEKHPGDIVNFEVDILAKYVESLLQGHRSGKPKLGSLDKDG